MDIPPYEIFVIIFILIIIVLYPSSGLTVNKNFHQEINICLSLVKPAELTAKLVKNISGESH